MGAPLRCFALPLLLAALACGGSRPGTPPATLLVYTDPADTTQWRLARDPASTASHLVLDLLAPAGASGMGVTLVLDLDGARASWSPTPPGTGGYAGPLFQKASLQGSELRLLVSQEHPTPPIAYAAAPVLTLALDLGRDVPPGPVALTASQAGHLAAPQAMPTAITVAVGALLAR